MEEEDALPDAHRGAVRNSSGPAPSCDAVGEAFAHVVNEKVRVKIRRLIGKRGDLDKLMEDLFARIQLCVLHPHSVIQRDGTTNEEERMF
jgi:hypothetical protein